MLAEQSSAYRGKMILLLQIGTLTTVKELSSADGHTGQFVMTDEPPVQSTWQSRQLQRGCCRFVVFPQKAMFGHLDRSEPLQNNRQMGLYDIIAGNRDAFRRKREWW